MNKANNNGIFDHVDVSKCFAEIDGYRYPKATNLTNFSGDVYLDQNRDFKSFYREYVGEELMTPFKSYTDLKNKNPIHVIDLRHQVDHITPKKFSCWKNIKMILFMLKKVYTLY